ncbi:hypothetical protein CCM_01249 [Cordyceps militaris CM01]|uniref:Uncharacterized protein n=1 Tax=Cordyceps militaris (strain CM01) TaxID=983644 RepID=G3J420_CORMM|nr:uncharacterized protein CCM_01249 [Cordyceps militaris CM01]EGX96591.1 hypothetical protein CCM_01249 [Cordyceps militaris CM01]
MLSGEGEKHNSFQGEASSSLFPAGFRVGHARAEDVLDSEVGTEHLGAIYKP